MRATFPEFREWPLAALGEHFDEDRVRSGFGSESDTLWSALALRVPLNLILVVHPLLLFFLISRCNFIMKRSLARTVSAPDLCRDQLARKW